MPRLDDILDPIAKGPTGTATEPDPKIILDHIAQVSQNARATWFGLLGLLAFVGVTLLGHKDADFFAYGAETQLPLIGITVPVKAFFYVAPMLVAALYTYLHLYLMTLWDGLADAPAQIDGQPLGDRVFPWLISYAALWYRNRRRGDGCTAPRSLGLVVVAVSLALGSALAIAVLGLLWWRSMPAHDEWLTLWIGLNFWFAFLVGQTGFLTVRARMAGATRASVSKAHWNRRVVGGIAVVILACLSWLRTEGGFENYAKWIERSGDWIGHPRAATWLNANLPTTDGIERISDLRWLRLYPADLAGAALTLAPPGWQPVEAAPAEGESGNDRDGDGALGIALAERRKRATEAFRRNNPELRAPDLRGADLRRAAMFRAFLPAADLRGARLQGAILSRTQMQGANLSVARMQGADIRYAKLQEVNFTEAQMQGVNLRGVEMQGANLSRASVQGADIAQVDLQGAILRQADLQGAVLGGTRMQGANCSGTMLRGALLGGAVATCVNLTQAQLAGTVGNERTVLPPGLTVPSCLETLPSEVEAALAFHPESAGRARAEHRVVREVLLCDPGETPHPTGRSAPN